MWDTEIVIPPSIIARPGAAGWSFITMQTNGAQYWKDSADHTKNWFDWPATLGSNLFLSLDYSPQTFVASPILYIEFFDLDSVSLGVLQYPNPASDFHGDVWYDHSDPVYPFPDYYGFEYVAPPGGYPTSLYLPPFPQYKAWSSSGDYFGLTLWSAPDLITVGHA